MNIAITVAAAMAIEGISIFDPLVPDRLPIRKELILSTISVFNVLSRLIPAVRKLETVIPARIIAILDVSAKYARANIRSDAVSAPKNANTG